jgi:hypothetical protein
MKFILTFFILGFLFMGCASDKNIDPVTGKSKNVELNVDKRARDAAAAGGGIFGEIGKRDNKNSNFEFSTSNVLWRATLSSLDFLPIANADYSGGVIIYDWYSDNLNSKEQIKITVRFLSSELKSNSIEILAHNRKCDINNNCVISIANNNITSEIKEKIISTARKIKIQESSKESR